MIGRIPRPNLIGRITAPAVIGRIAPPNLYARNIKVRRVDPASRTIARGDTDGIKVGGIDTAGWAIDRVDVSNLDPARGANARVDAGRVKTRSAGAFDRAGGAIVSAGTGRAIARVDPTDIASAPAASVVTSVDSVEAAQRDVERIDREHAHRTVRTGLARRGLIDRQQLQHPMARGEREIRHRRQPANLAAPEIIGRAQRKQRNHQAGDTLHHLLKRRETPVTVPHRAVIALRDWAKRPHSVTPPRSLLRKMEKSCLLTIDHAR
jgi:hypothetical protein